MKLAYQGFDYAGKAVSDTIDAGNVAEATQDLRRRGMFVTRIAPAEEALADPANKKPRTFAFRRGNRLANITMFARQLYVLVSSGTPMVQALVALERQAKQPHWQSVLSAIRQEIEQGASLSKAMEKFPDQFDPVCRSLVAAGESSGNLKEMLDRLSQLARKQLYIRRAIQGAMAYPALLVCVAVVVMAILLVFVIPRFSELFATLDVPLPASTKVLIYASTAFRSYWWAFAALTAAAAIGLRLYISGPGKIALDTLMLKLPQIGRITRSIATARITRLLGVLMESHVPILEAVELTRSSTGNHHYVRLMDAVQDAISKGEPMSSALSDTDLISPSVCEAIRSGEASGELGVLLLTMADFLDEENEVLVRSLTTILEPVILVFLGLLVGTVAMSIFMPLFDLTSMAQQGGA